MKIPGLVSVQHCPSSTNRVTAGKTQSSKIPGEELSRKMAPDDENLLHLIVHSVQNNKSARCADSKQLMKVKLSGTFASGYLSMIRYDTIRE